MFETPVLFLVFNRPGETKLVFEAIRKAAPKYFYIAADGPRAHKVREAELCESVRQIVAGIDWDCQVKTLYRDNNLGCGLAVSSAIDWFFQQVEYGIILEDDTLPDRSFFNYCQDLLHYYKDDHLVMHISGSHYAKSFNNSARYYFTRLPFIWGWATWRRAWNKYDFNYKNIDFEQKLRIIQKAFISSEIRNYWSNTLSDFHLKPKSFTWDYQWFLSIWDNGGLVIQPGKNLVQNIGFGLDATHTKDDSHNLVNVKAEEILDIKYAKKTLINEKLQNENFDFYFGSKEKSLSATMKKIFINPCISFVRKIIAKIAIKLFPELAILKDPGISWYHLKSGTYDCQLADNIKLYPPYHIYESSIGEYSYVALNSTIYRTDIGKFCSIGPNLFCGYGIHPTSALSTSPMFYSTDKPNGITLSASDKIIEKKRIIIGNDVFIGANVTILDGVTISDGAIIGAGAVVSKDIPAYAIAVGSPIHIIRYRFDTHQVKKLIKIKWWDFETKELYEVEKYFFDVDSFIKKYSI